MINDYQTNASIGLQPDIFWYGQTRHLCSSVNYKSNQYQLEYMQQSYLYHIDILLKIFD